MMKKFWAVLIAMLMVLTFAGCGSTQEAEVIEEEPVAEETADGLTEDVTEEVVEEAQEIKEDTAEAAQSDTANGEKADPDDIGLKKATKVALKDAGFKKADVKFTKRQADIDDGVKIYEIEFTQGETKYEYDIDAKTGKILDRDTDSIYDD